MLADLIYTTAKESLGSHITLDASVDPELGCAEAVSYVLQKAGVQGIPQRGFGGTHDLWQWIKNSRQFVQTVNPEKGGVVISPTGTSSLGASQHGHTGIVLAYGIGSNDSSTGLFKENYTYQSWGQSFGARGFPVFYFAPQC